MNIPVRPPLPPPLLLLRPAMSKVDECGVGAHGSIAHRLYCEIACTGEPGCFFDLDGATQQRWISGTAKVLGNQPEQPNHANSGATEDFDSGFSSAICLTLAYLHSAGDVCGTAYEEILHAANEDKVIAYARKEGEMRWTGLDKWCRHKKQRAAIAACTPAKEED